MKHRWLGILFLILVINSIYLVALPSPTVFYMGNSVLHLGLGVALTIAAVIVYRREGPPVRWMILAAILGLVLVYLGNTLPNRMVLLAHIGAGIVAVLSVFLW